MLKLFGNPSSPPSRLVHLILKYIEYPLDQENFEYINIDIFNNQQHEDDFKDLNPNRKVPVLKHQDFVLSESFSIVKYILNLREVNQKIYPKNTNRKLKYVQQRAQIDMHLSCLNDIRQELITQIQNNTILGMRGQQMPSEMQKHHNDTINKHTSYYETFIDKKPYLVGNQLTLADFGMYVQHLYHLLFKVDEQVKYPEFSKYIQKLKQNHQFFQEDEEQYIQSLLKIQSNMQ
eukprot:403360972